MPVGAQRSGVIRVATPVAFALSLVLVACTTTAPLPPASATAGTSEQPTVAAVATPAPTPSSAPTAEPQPIPTSALTGWWGTDGGSYCIPPAAYRLDGKKSGLGACFGGLFDPPNTTLALEVGQDLDIHMTVLGERRFMRYPLPTSSDPLVIRGWFIADQATMTYRALSPGTARLVTTGSCLLKDDSPTGVHEVTGPCPVVEVRVEPITTDCTTVALDLCRAAAAQAVLFGLFPADTGQHVVGWEARPASGGEWPACGRPVVRMTLTLGDPDGVTEVTVGQLDAGDPGPLKLGICTY